MRSQKRKLGLVGKVLWTHADARWGPGAWNYSTLASASGFVPSTVTRHMRQNRISLDAALTYAELFNVKALEVFAPTWKPRRNRT